MATANDAHNRQAGIIRQLEARIERLEDAATGKAREKVLKDAGQRVIDHHLRGKDKTAAGYYTAVTGIGVVGVVVEEVCSNCSHSNLSCEEIKCRCYCHEGKYSSAENEL